MPVSLQEVFCQRRLSHKRLGWSSNLCSKFWIETIGDCKIALSLFSMSVKLFTFETFLSPLQAVYACLWLFYNFPLQYCFYYMVWLLFCQYYFISTKCLYQCFSDKYITAHNHASKNSQNMSRIGIGKLSNSIFT